MNYFRFAIKEYKGKPVKTVIMLLIFTLTFTGVLTGMQLYFSTLKATEKAYYQIGVFLEINLDYSVDHPDRSECRITEEMISEVLKVSHVKGVNKRIADYARPVDFENSREHTGDINENGMQAEDEKGNDLAADAVIIDGNISPVFIDEFRMGTAELAEGSFPDKNHPGAVMEERLAAQNGLKPGDTISVMTTRCGTEEEMVITGLYRTKAVFEISESGWLGSRVFAMSPYNRIYTDLDTAARLFDRNPEEYALDIFIDDPGNLDSAAAQIKQLDFDWETLALYNMTKSRYAEQAGDITAMMNYSRLLLIFCILIGLILLSIVYSVTAKQYHYDGSILLAVGASKRQVITAYLFTTFLTACAGFALAVLLSLVTGPLVAGALNSLIPDIGMNITGEYSDGIIYDYSVRITALPAGYYAAAFGIALAVLLISSGGMIIYFTRYKTRKILGERS